MRRVLALVAVALAFWSTPARASFCLSPPMAEAVLGAAAVFEGTVAARVRLPSTGAIDPSYRVELTDVRALRGPVTDTLLHTSSGALVVGHRYLIAAHRGADGRLAVAPCVGWSGRQRDPRPGAVGSIRSGARRAVASSSGQSS
jgi:hypothetical protein